MKRILITTEHYLPGYKAGGPIRSIANLVELLGDEFDFFILTADRDFKDKTPYSGLTPDIWQTVGKARVQYLSPDHLTLDAWARLLCQLEYDLVYLNSFFARQTRHTLLLRRLGRIPKRPIIIAPRGEFSPGALGLKRLKKWVYIQVALRIGLYHNLIWHATSDSEIADIRSALVRFIPDIASRTMLAPNLAVALPAFSPTKRDPKQPHAIRIVFLSRVARKKNLDFALGVLQDLEGAVTLDIYGPKEDQEYWEECEQIIDRLPPNIQVTYGGSVTPDRVNDVLANYHLFFLPTRGENFGHAIVEAWAAGCPVLVSDQTPWRNLMEKGIGWDIPLSEPERFGQVLQQMIDMDETEFSSYSARCQQFVVDLMRKQVQDDLQSYRDLFKTAMSH